MSSDPNESVEPIPRPSRSLFRRLRPWLATVAAVAAASALLAFEVLATRPEREAVRSLSELMTLANLPDLSVDELTRRASFLCSRHYLETHTLEPAPEGGLVGFPRNLNKNFKVWRERGNVWIRPTDRVGPVYQFVEEAGRWKFDGPVGILDPQGAFIPAAELQ